VQDDFTTPRAQERDFRLTAITGNNGVAVFGLSWLKQYPWSKERPTIPTDSHGSWKDADSWSRPVDDIEKVKALQIRSPRYAGKRVRIDFDHLLEFGQNKSSEMQQQKVFDRYNAAWRNELGKGGVRFCVLKFGPRFSEYGNSRCRASEFFDKVRRNDLDITYSELQNLTGLSRQPQEYSGPYFIYSLQFALAPVSQQVEPEMRRPQREYRNEETPDRPRRESGETQPPTVESRPERVMQRSEDDSSRQRSVEAIRPVEPPPRAVEAVTSRLAKEKGLFMGIRGVYLNDPMGGLPAGVVVESVQHRLIESEDQFYQAIRGQREVIVGIWQRNSQGRWERADRMFRPSN
jgi:hypothetical protein